MSFGFSIGDFLAVIALAKKVRKNFAGAPEQFQQISAEVRNLTIVLEDIEVSVPVDEIPTAQSDDLAEIIQGCRQVLENITAKVNQYCEVSAGAKSLAGSAKRAWKRLRWEPDDIRDLRSQITSNTALLTSFLHRITQGLTLTTSLNVVELVDRQDEQRHQASLEWLIPADINDAKLADAINKSQPGTGQWFLECAEYEQWVSTEGKILFCPGIPGAGKTILSSIVVERLRDIFETKSSVGICHVYCDHQRESTQNLDTFLRSLLKQLARAHTPFPPLVEELYTRHSSQGSRPSIEELRLGIHSLASSLSRVFVVVDALDECQETGGCRSLLISDLKNLRADLGANIFATSRFIPEIESRFEDAVQVEIKASESDIRRYLDAKIPYIQGYVSRHQELHEEIKQSILDRVDGMFLLAQLHLDSLRGKSRVKAVRTALGNLAKGSNAYDEAYKNAMARINGQVQDQRELAMQTLSWIVCAKRPLKPEELRHALGVEVGESDMNLDNLPDLQDVLSSCCGLVAIDEESDVVGLVHHTTRQYFERTQETWFPDAQREITKVCLTYLDLNAFDSGWIWKPRDYVRQLFLHPLYIYASNYWGRHAYHVSNFYDLSKFSKAGSKVDAAAQGLFGFWGIAGRQMTRLHLAAYFGLHEAISDLMDQQSIDKETPGGGTPLLYAAGAGHEAVARLLLEGGAQVDGGNQPGTTTPLIAAARRSHVTIVRLLLEKGADINLGDVRGETPLHAAALWGHEDVARLLLEMGAQVDPRNKTGKTPLWIAALMECDAIARLLLDNGANSDSIALASPESRATEFGHSADKESEALAGQIFDKLSVLETQELIARRAYQDAVKQFLEKGTAVGLSVDSDWALLSRAARKENSAIAQLLLGEDAERDRESDDGSEFRDLSGLDKMETYLTMVSPEKSDELSAARAELAVNAQKS